MSADADPRALLSEFGRRLGIPDVTFDGQANCRLGFDDIVLDIEWQSDAGELVIQSDIGDLPSQRNAEFLTRLLELNLGSALTTAGSVGINRNTNRLIYTDHTPLRGLTIETLERFIQVSVNLVEAWRNIIESRQFAQPDAGESISSEFAAMIRV
jgi:hypothetical protein